MKKEEQFFKNSCTLCTEFKTSQPAPHGREMDKQAQDGEEKVLPVLPPWWLDWLDKHDLGHKLLSELRCLEKRPETAIACSGQPAISLLQ